MGLWGGEGRAIDGFICRKGFDIERFAIFDGGYFLSWCWGTRTTASSSCNFFFTHQCACLPVYFPALAAHLMHPCPVRVSTIDERLSSVLYMCTVYIALHLPSFLFFVSRHRHTVDVVRTCLIPFQGWAAGRLHTPHLVPLVARAPSNPSRRRRCISQALTCREWSADFVSVLGCDTAPRGGGQ